LKEVDREYFVVAPMLASARECTALGNDDAAKKIYFGILQRDPKNRLALIELGVIALTNGHREAARTVFLQAARCHPDDLTSLVTLGNMALEDGDLQTARVHYQEALQHDPDCAQAHQGMARILSNLGEEAAATPYWEKGFSGHAVIPRQYRGVGAGEDVLLLVAARGGNVRLRPWMDDRILAVTTIYAEYYDITQPLPPHKLVVNAIGDADLCAAALTKAQAIIAGSPAPVLNQPMRVCATGRAEISRSCVGIEGMIVPNIRLMPRADILAADHLLFPLLLRTPGLHTGQHFVLAESRETLGDKIATLPGDALFAIEYFNTRGADGLARKYRVMFIDGKIYPCHLAISEDWKVHYYTAAMAENVIYREEERRFLEDMSGVLGPRAMAALDALRRTLGLDFAGADFALTTDGSVLLFEANATMAINAPPSGGLWDYRREATETVQRATRQMLMRRVQAC
jgi:hypothetical protein